MSLDAGEAEALFGRMLDGAMAEDAIAGLLVEMATRGETPAEIAGAARALRARMLPLALPEDLAARAIDVCGTGGDGQHTRNISTAVALVVAACGVPVAKHGNRAVSSRAGAADTLAALGLNLARAGEMAAATLGDLGIAFIFAPAHHPALARLAGLRKALGRRTIFNLLGPLANPAQVRRQLMGVATPVLVPRCAEALAMLGTERALVVSGEEGLDELSLAGGNVMAEVRAGAEVVMGAVSAADAGLAPAPLAALRGGDAADNAAALRAVLRGEVGAHRDAVLFNAAAALMVAGAVADWREGAEEAAEVLDKGLANTLLDCWIAMTA